MSDLDGIARAETAALAGLEPVERKARAEELRVIGLELVAAAGEATASAMRDARARWGVERGAEALGVSPGYLRRRAATHRAQPRTAAARRARALELYAEGLAAYIVADMIGSSPASVRRWLREAGVPLRETHTRRTP